MAELYNLQRFLDAQQRDFETARNELLAGRKRSHWIWYIFPQLKGLGHSHNSEYYGIGGLEEAMAYLKHPVLGTRLIELVTIVLGHKNKTAEEIFGSPDNMKFHSCITLFSLEPNADEVFKTAIEQFFGGEADETTIKGASR
jgi:uncharacterized protein (DUF1810 family)